MPWTQGEPAAGAFAHLVDTRSQTKSAKQPVVVEPVVSEQGLPISCGTEHVPTVPEAPSPTQTCRPLHSGEGNPPAEQAPPASAGAVHVPPHPPVGLQYEPAAHGVMRPPPIGAQGTVQCCPTEMEGPGLHWKSAGTGPSHHSVAAQSLSFLQAPPLAATPQVPLAVEQWPVAHCVSDVHPVPSASFAAQVPGQALFARLQVAAPLQSMSS